MPEPTILIVDDDADMRFLAKAALRHVDPYAKFRVLDAADGPSALRLAQRVLADRTPLLVLCDQRMPGMTGAEVSVAFAKMRGDTPTRFVLFSSLREGSQLDPRRSGAADEVLEKGFGTAQWREQIGRVVRAWGAALSQR